VDLGGGPVLRRSDLELRRGEIVALIGRNGAGKTTLLRALAGLQAPTRGRIERHGRAGYVPQDPNLLLSASTVRRELEHTQKLLQLDDPDALERWLARQARGA